MREPIKGDFYLIPYHACGAKLKYGTRVCQYEKRTSRGCQLHGELLAYEYHFKLNPESDYASVMVTVPADESDDEVNTQKKIDDHLWKKIKPLKNFQY